MSQAVYSSSVIIHHHHCFKGSLEAAGPAVAQSSSRTLTPVESPEDPRERVDDGDYSGKSSGRS